MKRAILTAIGVVSLAICLAVGASATEKALTYNAEGGYYYDSSSGFVYELAQEDNTALVKGNPQAIAPDSVFEYGSSALVPQSVSANGESYTVKGVVADGFADDKKVKSVVFESAVKVGERAFMGATSLASVDLTGVTEIGDGAFSYTALKSIAIPDSLEKIGGSAFYYSAELKQLDGIEKTTLKDVGPDAFAGTAWFTNKNDEFVIVGDGILVKHNSMSNTLVVPYDVKRIAGGFCKNTALETVDFTYATNLTHIGGYTFYGCNSITEIVLPSTVEYIGEMAFSACAALRSVTGGQGVKVIDFCAFSGCTALETVELASPVLTYIGECAFWNCTSLNSITLTTCPAVINIGVFWNSGLTYYEIPEGTTTIAKGAFASIPTIKLQLPRSVENIDGEAFSKSGVTIVCYPGTPSATYAKQDGFIAGDAYYYGDIDNDKEITVADLACGARAVMGITDATSTSSAYVQNTGRQVNLKELSSLMKYLASTANSTVGE